MMPRLIIAFDEVRDGVSSDRVVADPELNVLFISACGCRGLTQPAVDLNMKLLNARKRGQLPRTTRQTVVRDPDAFAFASEIAIRSLERKHQTTLDRVLCDPLLVCEFDQVAGNIVPGFTPLECRWAALRLRKSSRLQPELLGRVVPTDVCGPVDVADLDPEKVPDEQGLYILTSRDKVLYVGEAQNLRLRLRKHLDHSDNKYLAQYIWEFGKGDMLLEYHVLPRGTTSRVRRAMELELIRSRHAEFNVRR